MTTTITTTGEYTVFADHPTTGIEIAALHVEASREDAAYTASALANHLHDLGYQVSHDLWGAQVDDAMVSPAVWAEYRLARYPSLTNQTVV